MCAPAGGFLYVTNCYPRRKSIAPMLLSLGSGAPHGRKDMSHGADVLFHTFFVDGIVVGRKDAHADLVGEYL